MKGMEYVNGRATKKKMKKKVMGSEQKSITFCGLLLSRKVFGIQRF